MADMILIVNQISHQVTDRISCTLALKSDIWWQQFLWFSSETIDQISCIR